jgi:predicted alpha/beta superfamily hydrolase
MYDDGAGTELGGNIVGNIRRLAGIESPQLGNRRDVLVYLPPSYSTSGRHYPVVYMHDGQNLFDAATSYAGEWHVDETMERAARDGVEAVIVGIPNTGPGRASEYSPFRDDRLGPGRGDEYLDFIVDTVKPIVDSQFRTRRDPEHTGIAGSSMGGLISLYGFLHRPDAFGFAGVMSPSLWVGRGAVFEFAAAMTSWPGRLYMDTGTAEGRGQVRQTREMVRLLRRRAAKPRLQLHYVEEHGAGHNEAAWAARFDRTIRWLLPRRRVDINW